MDKFLIIADDFTGAYDTGVQLKKRGIEAQVVFDTKNMIKDQSYIIDTESRGLENNDAYKKIESMVKEIEINSFNFYFKKVDSTLRGNIGCEIKAIDEILNFELIVFVPAYPKIKRIIVDGTLLLNNIPIKNTDIVYDPRNIVREDNVKKLLEYEIGEEVQHIELNDVRKKSFNTNFDAKRILSFDAITDDDMDLIVKNILNLQKKTLWVGSIGLADAMLRVLYPTKPVLCVIGSTSDSTRNQIDYAVSKGASLVQINITSIIKGLSENVFINEAIKEINSGNDVILCTSIDKNDVSDAINEGEKIGIQRKDLFDFINKILGKISCKILNKIMVSGVFLSGGDTAVSFLKHNSISDPKIIGELLPSIPLLSLDRADKTNLKVAIKGGHVGRVGTLHYCINKLKEN